MAVNITTDTNTVKVTSTSTNNVKIVDNGNNTSVTVSQPTTRVIKVVTVGPQGPVGPIPNTGSFATTGSNTFRGNQTISGSIYLRSGSVINSTGADIGIRAGVGNNAGVALYNNSFTQYLAVDDTGSYANKFTVADRLTVMGSNGRLVYTGTTPVYPYTLAEIHANDDYPWLHRFYNDTFSTSSAVMAYFGYNDGRFVFHNESTQSIGLQVNGFGAENGLLVYSDRVAFINNVVVTGSLNVSGSITGAANLATTGSVTFTGNQIVTGSTRGNVTALTIASNTASIDLSTGNFFTLQLISGSNTYINPSNILPGQTSILTLSTTGSATVSFPSFVKQPSGSAYIPTTSSGVDILTFASTDSSTLYVVGIKNMI